MIIFIKLVYLSSVIKNKGGTWFCPWGIDWMVLVCYWWISCEWQVGLAPQ